MKLNRSNIKTLLDTLSRVRPELVKLTCDNNKLVAFGTNGVTSFRVECDCVGSLDAITLNANLFVSVVSKLSTNDFEVSATSSCCVISNDTSSFKITLSSNDSVPDFEANKDIDSVSIPTNLLVRLISKVSFAAAQKQTRPILAGINLCAKDGTLVATGLDGARMSRVDTNIDNNANFNFTVPSKDITSVVGLFSAEKNVAISSDTRRVVLEQDNIVIVTSIICGDYPEVDRLVPKSVETSVKFDKNELISAIENVSILADDKRVVKFSIANSSCVLESNNNEVGSAKQNIAYESSVNEFIILFNANYLLDALKSIDDSNVELCFTGSLRPFFIKDSSGHQVELLTPIRS